jgi:hypothetical protein
VIHGLFSLSLRRRGLQDTDTTYYYNRYANTGDCQRAVGMVLEPLVNGYEFAEHFLTRARGHILHYPHNRGTVRLLEWRDISLIDNESDLLIRGNCAREKRQRES